jgi:hypothetical protein
MALTVKMVKAQSRPSSGYTIGFKAIAPTPGRYQIHPYARAAPTALGMRQKGYASGQRRTVSRSPGDNLKLRPRTIIP